MEKLPEEILLQIASFLHAYDLLPLHLVSKHLSKIAHDNELWRALVSDKSKLSIARRRDDFLSRAPVPVPDPAVLQLRAAVKSAAENASVEGHEPKSTRDGSQTLRAQISRTEDVDFYHEYIARHSPLSLSWLQQPIEARTKRNNEVRGLGLVGGFNETIVAPLDDDSICLWTIGGGDDTSNQFRGSIQARSRPGILTAHGPPGASRAAGSWHHDMPWREAVVENVSVDKLRNTAYFAVQGSLNEINLDTLQLVSLQRYPSAIRALSTMSPSAPLTVATATSLHIHDHRLSQDTLNSTNDSDSDRLDSPSVTTLANANDYHQPLLGASAPSHAPLIHSPLSIVHLPSSQTIHLAGRFPSILTYDRRTFPKVHSTIHSGARLSSLTSKSSPDTNTLIACGEYNGKGSLELYRLSASASDEDSSSSAPLLLSSFQNRTSAARSKLLSVASYGTRIVFCDGDGMLNWVEGDGSTLVRRWNINSASDHRTPRGLFGGGSEAGGSDVARKIVPLDEGPKSELVIRAGEKIGIVSCSRKPMWGVEEGEGGEEERTVEEEYEGRMRRALERQADEVRFMQGLGLRV